MYFHPNFIHGTHLLTWSFTFVLHIASIWNMNVNIAFKYECIQIINPLMKRDTNEPWVNRSFEFHEIKSAKVNSEDPSARFLRLWVFANNTLSIVGILFTPKAYKFSWGGTNPTVWKTPKNWIAYATLKRHLNIYLGFI